MANKDKKGLPNVPIRRTDQESGLNAMFPTDPQPMDTTATGSPRQTRNGRYRGQRTTTADERQQITFKLPADTIAKIRALAYWERREQWAIVDDALRAAIDKYERKNGTIEPIPNK